MNKVCADHACGKGECNAGSSASSSNPIELQRGMKNSNLLRFRRKQFIQQKFTKKVKRKIENEF